MSIADVFQPPREGPSASKLSCGMPLFSHFQAICFSLFLLKEQVTIKCLFSHIQVRKLEMALKVIGFLGFNFI